MKKLLFFLVCIPILSYSINDNINGIIYYGKDFFIIEGSSIPDSLKESSYDRLPKSYKSIVREPVWNLSKSSAGLSIRFFSNSTSISVKWEVLNDLKMNHMAETGIKGVDLYHKNNNRWEYVNTCLLYTSPSPRDS